MSKEILSIKSIKRTYRYVVPKTSLFYFKRVLPLSVLSTNLPDYSYLVGKIMGDGHIDKRYSIKFIAGDTSQLDLIYNYLTKKFFIPFNRMKISKKVSTKGLSYVLHVNYSPFGRILSQLGAPVGNKTMNAFSVPKWILINNNTKRLFLQALLEDELTTIKIEKKFHANSPVLKLIKHPNHVNSLREFLYEIKKMINDLGISTSEISKSIVTENGKISMYLRLNQNKENIIKFSQNIGFRFNVIKKNKLKDCVKVLRKTRYNRKVSVNMGKLQEYINRGYSIRRISQLMKVNRSSIHSRMLMLKFNTKKNLLKKMECDTL
tara:strand:- start:1234 stop:2193 length:960 start_codon:yes stop_codon:yes gene_type:complete